jgi:hypothetical protein
MPIRGAAGANGLQVCLSRTFPEQNEAPNGNAIDRIQAHRVGTEVAIR